MQENRVVITGMGVVSPLGNSVDVLFSSLLDGQSALRRHSSIDLPVAIGVVDLSDCDDFSRRQMFTLDRSSQFALRACEQAVVESQIQTHSLKKAGIYWGSGAGGVGVQEDFYRRFFGGKRNFSPLTIPSGMMHASAAQIGIHFGIHGECITYSTACASGATAIGEAWLKLKTGVNEIAIAGGSEACLYAGAINCWQSLGVLCSVDDEGYPLNCSPFAANRQGFCLGEGGAALVLESLNHALNRGAPIIAELIGCGMTNDGSHITNPNSHTQANAIRKALHIAGLRPSEIDYINTHGTGTIAGDLSEYRAMESVFGTENNHRPLSTSTKSATGHLLGAAGALELIIAVQALRLQKIPSTIGWKTPDPLMHGWDFVLDCARSVDLRCVMSNSFAFGGCNVVLIAKQVNCGNIGVHEKKADVKFCRFQRNE